MLSIDTELADSALVKRVADHCGRHGKVEAVLIVRQPAPTHEAVYALVRMGTIESALAVRRSFGDMMYGNTSVYIGLRAASLRETAAA